VKQRDSAGSVSPTTTAPLWVSGIATKDGGSIYADSITSAMLVNLYCEGTQGQPFLNATNLIAFGGDIEGNPNSLGIFIAGSGNGLTAKFGKPYCAQYIDPATGIAQRASLGFGGNSGDFFQYYHDTFFPGNGWLGARSGPDLAFGTDLSNPHFFLTGPSTTQQFGRTVAVPNAIRLPLLVLGSSANGRVITSGTAIPTTGTHAVGEIVFNSAPTAGGKIGWVCTTAGTPGTWKAFGVIDP